MTNPQTREAYGRSRAGRARWSWIRSNLADPAAAGDDLDPADVNHLPASLRERARLIASTARRMHERGEQGDALQYAREQFAEIADGLDRRWTPPAPERPDRELIAEIRGEVV